MTNRFLTWTFYILTHPSLVITTLLLFHCQQVTLSFMDTLIALTYLFSAFVYLANFPRSSHVSRSSRIKTLGFPKRIFTGQIPLWMPDSTVKPLQVVPTENSLCICTLLHHIWRVFTKSVQTIMLQLLTFLANRKTTIKPPA